MLACSLALTVLAAAPQSSEVVERTYDVRALDTFAEVDATVPDPRLPVDALFRGALDDGPGWLEWPDKTTFTDPSWVGMIGDLLTEEESPELYSLLEEDGELLVQATPRVHAVIDELLGGLEAVGLRECRVDVTLLDPERLLATDVGVVSAERAAELVRSKAARGGHVLRGTTSRPLTFRMIASQATLPAYDVEAVQYATATDPYVLVAQSGSIGGVVVSSRLDGSTSLRAWVRWSEFDDPMRQLVAGARGEVAQLPAARALVAVSSADLRAGEAIVLTGLGFPHAVLLRARVDEPAAERSDELMYFDLTEVLSSPFVVQPLVTFGPLPSGGLYLDDSEDGYIDPFPPLYEQDVFDLLAPRVELPMTLMGRTLVVRTQGADRAELARSVAAVTPPAPATYVVEVRGGVVPRERALALEDAVDPDLVRELPGLGGGATLESGTLALVAGKQHSYVKDYDVEVAQGAFIAQPIPDTVFEGTKLWARVLRGFEGRVDVEYGASTSELEDIGQPLSVTDPDTEFPALSLPTVKIIDHWGDHSLPLGEWVHVRSDVVDSDRTHVLLMRVTERAR